MRFYLTPLYIGIEIGRHGLGVMFSLYPRQWFQIHRYSIEGSRIVRCGVFYYFREPFETEGS